MNVVHARANLVGVIEGFEYIQQLHVRARAFYGDDIGVHVRNGFNDIVELGVTHVGVNLGVILDAVGADAEGAHSPVQVVLPL